MTWCRQGWGIIINIICLAALNRVYSVAANKTAKHRYLNVIASIFTCICSAENMCIFIQISLKLARKDTGNNKLLSQYWFRWWLGTKHAQSHYKNQSRRLAFICLTRHQWVKWSVPSRVNPIWHRSLNSLMLVAPFTKRANTLGSGQNHRHLSDGILNAL